MQFLLLPPLQGFWHDSLSSDIAESAVENTDFQSQPCQVLKGVFEHRPY